MVHTVTKIQIEPGKDYFRDQGQADLIGRLPEKFRADAAKLSPGPHVEARACLLLQQLSREGMGEEGRRIIESLITKSLADAFKAAVLDETALADPTTIRERPQ